MDPETLVKIDAAAWAARRAVWLAMSKQRKGKGVSNKAAMRIFVLRIQEAARKLSSGQRVEIRVRTLESKHPWIRKAMVDAEDAVCKTLEGLKTTESEHAVEAFRAALARAVIELGQAKAESEELFERWLAEQVGCWFIPNLQTA
jgi:phage-related tail protein